MRPGITVCAHAAPFVALCATARAAEPGSTDITRATAALALVAMLALLGLIVLVVGVLIARRVAARTRDTVPPRSAPEGKDAWAESARRLRTPPPDEESREELP